MPGSNRRAATGRRFDRRVLGAAGALVVFGGIIGVTQISSADESEQRTTIEINGLDVIANSCEGSGLAAHDGFQKGDRCVSTAFGEVGSAEKNPTLLITEAPETVGVGEAFTLRVSTRNLIRDRFLAAGQGGYYVESSTLNGDGLVRGHFHTACRMLNSTSEAPAPEPVPAFFVATEDSRGGSAPDEVAIQVPGLPEEGTAQCASWAGDGSHRIPMMVRANQTPAVDAIRLEVRGNGGGEEPPAEEPQEPPAEEPQEPPAEEPQEPPAEEPQEPEQPQEPPANGGGEAPAAPQQPNVKDTVTPDKESEPETETETETKTETKTETAPKAEAPAKTATGSGSGSGTGSGTGTGTSSGDTKTDAKPESAPKTAESEDDVTLGQAEYDDGAPDAQQNLVADNAPPAADDDGILALTGSNTMAWLGGGAVLLFIGFVVMMATRRKRPGWR